MHYLAARLYYLKRKKRKKKRKIGISITKGLYVDEQSFASFVTHSKNVLNYTGYICSEHLPAFVVLLQMNTISLRNL